MFCFWYVVVVVVVVVGGFGLLFFFVFSGISTSYSQPSLKF